MAINSQDTYHDSRTNSTVPYYPTYDVHTHNLSFDPNNPLTLTVYNGQGIVCAFNNNTLTIDVNWQTFHEYIESMINNKFDRVFHNIIHEDIPKEVLRYQEQHIKSLVEKGLADTKESILKSAETRIEKRAISVENLITQKIKYFSNTLEQLLLHKCEQIIAKLTNPKEDY